jgi:DnaJ homolog subfamily C member 7
LLAAGKPQEAVAAITAGLIKEPGNSAALKDRKEAEEVANRLTLAKQCLAKKQYVQVWKQIQMIEKHMSAGDEMTMMKIEALCCIGRHNEAYALTTSLMRTNARYPGLLFWRAKCLYYMDQVPPAIKHLQECMRNDPDNNEYRAEIKKWRLMEAQKEAGNEAFKNGRYQEAIEKWGECLSIDPDHRSYNAKLLLNRGTAQAKLKEYAKAVEDCNKAIELDDKYIKAYNKRAECLRLLGEKEHLEQAVRDLEKAMELDSEDNKRSYQTKIKEAKVELKRAGQEDLYKVMVECQ